MLIFLKNIQRGDPLKKYFWGFLFNTVFYHRILKDTIRMPFRGLTMLKSLKLIIKVGLCYGFAIYKKKIIFLKNIQNFFWGFLFNTVFYNGILQDITRMPFRGLTMLKSPKLIIKGGLCYGFAMVCATLVICPCLFLAMSRLSFILCCSLPAASHSLLTLAPAPVLTNSRLMPRSSSAMPAHNSSVD